MKKLELNQMEVLLGGQTQPVEQVPFYLKKIKINEKSKNHQ